MSVRPPARPILPSAPNRARGLQTVDRYLLALDGLIELDRSAFEALEAEFIEEAKIFALRVGISYEAWIDVGVSTEVLRRAGLAVDSEMCGDLLIG